MLPEIDAYQRRKSKLSVIASASGSADASASSSATAPPKMTHNKFLFVALLNLTFSQTADYPWDTHGAGITIIPCMIRVWSVCHLSAWHWPYNTLASTSPPFPNPFLTVRDISTGIVCGQAWWALGAVLCGRGIQAWLSSDECRGKRQIHQLLNIITFGFRIMQTHTQAHTHKGRRQEEGEYRGQGRQTVMQVLQRHSPH